MKAAIPVHPPASAKLSILGVLSIVVGLLTVIVMILAMLIGWRMNVMAQPAIVLWSAMPASGVGIALAVLALIQRGRRQNTAHYGLWINGMVAMFAAPVAMAWSLAF